MTAGFDWGKDPTITITHPECDDLTISIAFRGFPASRFMNRFAETLTKDGFVLSVEREVEIVHRRDQWVLSSNESPEQHLTKENDDG